MFINKKENAYLIKIYKNNSKYNVKEFYGDLEYIRDCIREMNFFEYYVSEEDRKRFADDESLMKDYETYLKIEKEREKYKNNVVQLIKLIRRYNLMCMKWDRMEVYNPDGSLLHSFRVYKKPEEYDWC